MKFVSASLFLSLMGVASALEEPSSILESKQSERHLKKLLELDEGFAKLQQDTERDLQIGSGLFCEKQLDACRTYTGGNSVELWSTYLAPMQNGTLPFGLGPLFAVIELFTNIGLVIGETLGLVTLTNVLTVVENVLGVLSDLLSRFRTMTFEAVVTEMIELEQQTSEVFVESEAMWDQFATLQDQVLAILQGAVNQAQARGSMAVSSAYDVIASLLNFYAELYRSIVAVGLGPTSQAVVDCQAGRVSCSIDRLAIDVIPALTSLVVYLGAENNATAANATLPIVSNATAPVAANSTASNATVTP
jgi:hypothetical protein